MVIKIVLAAIALVYIMPLLIILTNSFMAQGEINRHFGSVYDVLDYEFSGQIHYAEYKLIPEQVSLGQYAALLFKTPEYLELFFNSIKLSLPIVLIQVAVGTAAAYGFTVWGSRFKEAIFCAYIVLMLLPTQATLVSNYIIADKLGILNTYLSIILPWGFNPFAVFVIRQSMKGLPFSVFEAAQIDGASHWQRFIYIALPLSKGGVASLAILSFSDCWAMVEQPLVFLRDANMAPLSVLLSQIGQENMGLIFAASVFYMMPVVWAFLYGQEYFEQGIKLSALR
ncbi:MAG: carbohydrate ABC transporter permease [Clostridiales bacterium]|jgi:multiple sugar transport system permease protein|nr:carbohydrate ABC transporter permease [Clostridiales bacterium]